MGKNNQKTVKIYKEPTNSRNVYATINIAAMEEAKKNLNDGAFALWLYFAKNQNHFSFDLSSKAVERDFNIKRSQYNSAVKELTENRYLIDVNTDPNAVANLWEFHEKPVEPPAPPKQIKPQQQKTKTIQEFSFLEDDYVF